MQTNILVQYLETVMGKETTIFTKICVPKFIIFELWNSKDKGLKKSD